jgi:hypothetical protein
MRREFRSSAARPRRVWPAPSAAASTTGLSPVCDCSASPLYSASRTEAGCPSGQWERTVNPSAYAYPGSNPGPATQVRGHFRPTGPPEDWRPPADRPQQSARPCRKLRDGVQVVGEEVPVAVQRQHRRLVPQKPLHHLHVRARTDHQRRTGVPQVMQPGTVDPADRRDRVREGVARLPEGQMPAAPRQVNTRAPSSRSAIIQSDEYLWTGRQAAHSPGREALHSRRPRVRFGILPHLTAAQRDRSGTR